MPPPWGPITCILAIDTIYPYCSKSSQADPGWALEREENSTESINNNIYEYVIFDVLLIMLYNEVSFLWDEVFPLQGFLTVVKMIVEQTA